MIASAEQLEEQIEALLTAPTFSLEPSEHAQRLLALLQRELAHAAARNPRLREYFNAWPIDYRAATTIADLPYLPVGAFKANPPLTLVAPEQIIHTLSSSATTGQTPSRVALDTPTSRRMVKGVVSIASDFIGAKRRPYLVIDTPETLAGLGDLGARAAAIQGLRAFATEMVCCLRGATGAEPEVDEPQLLDVAARWRDSEVLVYGFTYVIWQHFVVPLRERGVRLAMRNVRILHSGGWKRLQAQAVTPAAFAAGVGQVFGCDPARVLDFYGMVENVGVIYPDCEQGNKHVPAFAAVIVRDPLTLRPVEEGQQGLVQVCSALPTSFPGFLVLTDDIAQVVHYDGCRCGRRGIAFRFVRRVPQAEMRGCGNIETTRQRPPAVLSVHA
ncbi:MAG: acyl-protein synthetase [Gammaproteobacteria bacterium]|nr:acyl-protein synthetase [Gammaproteobacteria bacterium]